MTSVIWYIIIIHRIGTIIALMAALVLPLLPHIFTQNEDARFEALSFAVLLWLVRIGLIILTLSGLWRLSYGIPSAFPIKLILILLDFYLYTRPPVTPQHDRYTPTTAAMALALFITAGVGLYL